MKSATYSVSVIIPTLNAEKELPGLLDRLHKQTLHPAEVIVIDSASDDNTSLVCAKDPSVRFIPIQREDFDHGRTRDIAIRVAGGDYVVFLTQDVIPANNELLQRLTEPLIKGDAIVSTGRQLPKTDASYMEASVRAYNYPDTSAIRSKKDIPTLGIKTFFCSDVCSAYNKEIYLELGGFEYPIKTNEDMLFAAKAINNGYSVAYVAEAIVYHSHELTLRQQFRRNYIQGYEIERHKALLGEGSLASEGKKMVTHVVRDLLQKGHPISAASFVADCTARYLGNRAGRYRYEWERKRTQ